MRYLVRFYAIQVYFGAFVSSRISYKKPVLRMPFGSDMKARRSNSRRSYVVERQFGVLVGAVFAALGGWWLARGKFQLVAPYFLTLGGLLLLAGLIYPRVLVVPNRLWMKLAEALSFVMTRVILGLVFFLMVTPLGLLRRMLGGDPLHRRGRREDSYWKPYLVRQRDPLHYEKMF